MFNESQEKVAYDDVYTFARQRNPETTRLIYRESIEDPELTRYITALANTFGGHIIIGISPHAKTRRPSTFKGISSFDESYLKSIIASIDPYPRHRVRVTDNKNGHQFVVLDIPEGLYGPYRSLGEPHNVWMLSGDSMGLSQATTKDILRINDKSKANDKNRQLVLQRERQIFSLLCTERKEKTTDDQKESVYEPDLFEKMPYVTCSVYPRDIKVGSIRTRPQKLNSWLVNLPFQRTACLSVSEAA